MTSPQAITSLLTKGELDKHQLELKRKAEAEQRLFEQLQGWSDSNQTALFLGAIQKEIDSLDTKLDYSVNHSADTLRVLIAERAALRKVLNLAHTGIYE